MLPQERSSLGVWASTCWNWKCALLSAIVRSLVYLMAIARGELRSGLTVVLVEMVYVTLTAGIYAGMQQKALALRSRLLGNLVIVLAVPALAQTLDWTTHRILDAAVNAKATLAVGIFAAISALFHLHVMRNGVFLSGQGRSLSDDFRRMPRLVLGFLLQPITLLIASSSRPASAVESKAVL